MHLKRNKVPKIWPLARKGTTYLVRPIGGLDNGIPVLIALRDMLEVAGTRKDVKNILKQGKAKVNGKVVREEKYLIRLFDNLTLDKNYKLVIKNKKFALIEDKNENEKIAKVIGKKILAGNKTQINLSDGRNYISKDKIKTGDSVLIDLKANKIEKVLEFKEGSKVLFISGKHLGREGKVDKIKDNMLEVKSGDEKINTKLEGLMVI